MQLETIQNLAMVPVRGTVYVVKLPFVCVWRVVLFLWACVYTVFATILSFPAYYAKRLYDRIVFTWSWTKLFVRRSLGISVKSPAAITDGRQAFQPRDYHSPPMLGHPTHIQPEGDGDPFMQSPYHGVYRRHGRRSKRERKAMISQLLRLLLEPSSPVESEDEAERTSSARTPGPEQDEAEKALSLIVDLVRLSKSGGHDPVVGDSTRHTATIKEDLEARLCQARDRERLQALITELDQLAIEVDPSILLCKSSGSSSHPSPSHTVVETDRPSSSSSLYTPNPSSAVSSSDEYMDDNEQFHDVEETPAAFERPLFKHGALSPVQESPEYLSASSESLKMNQLEDELTKALSNLTTATKGLNADQEMVESMETEITQKTVTVTESAARDYDLESVPKTAPVLGVQVGHERRDLASVRNSRPPSRRPGGSQSQDSNQVADNGHGDLDSESDEELSKGDSASKPAVRQLPPLLLKDQIQLLTSGWTSPTGNVCEGDETGDPAVSDSRQHNSSDPGPQAIGEGQRSRRESSSSDTGAMKITSSQPPWIEMRRNRTNSNSSSNSATTPTGSTNTAFPVVVYTPPPRKAKVESAEAAPSSRGKEASMWDTDPALDNREGLYDTLGPKKEENTPLQPVYLHERFAGRNGTSSEEPSPRLPPRNNLALKRTASAEAISKPMSDKPPQRSGSEKRSSSTRKSLRDTESRESSKERHGRSRDREPRESRSRERESRSSRSRDKRESSTRESRSRDKDSHQSRRREKDRHEHRSSHHSHSSERSRSHSEHRHSSDRHHHRSRSGDRSSSHSTERHSSSHRHSHSDRHRSRSSDKSSATPPSQSSEGKSKASASPSPAKGRITSLFSRSSTKESPKEKKAKLKSKAKTGSSDTTPEKRSIRRVGSTSAASSPDKEDSPPAGVARSTSLSSLKSAGAASVYSFDSVISGKNTKV